MIRLMTLVLLLVPFFSYPQGRIEDEMESQEELLTASTKQLNQFFRRFNGEEDEDGNRYYPDDRKYRDEKLRRKYLPILFDASSNPDKDLAKRFIEEMTNKNNPVFIDLRTQGLVAEVSANFSFNGKSTGMLLYMELQEQGKGYEWIIRDVSFDQFSSKFQKDKSDSKPFVHPMSHELTFMNLKKAFDKGRPESYTSDDFEPDYLSIFLYEMNSGRLKFETVKGLKYHLFGIEGWYLEIANFNRPGYNTGWLISNFMAVSNEEKDQVRNYIYGN